jgi:hypothetical protein
MKQTQSVLLAALLVVCVLLGTATAQLTWSRVNPTTSNNPRGRRDAAVAYVSANRQLLVFGGRDSSGTALGDTWFYYLDTNAWVPVSTPVAPTARSNMVYGFVETSSTDRKFYVALGKSTSGAALSDVWVFDLGTSTWSRLDTTGDVPTGIMSPIGGLLPSLPASAAKFVVLSGSGSEDSEERHTKAFVLDIASKTWTKVVSDVDNLYNPNKPQARSEFSGAAVSSSKVVVFGGCLTGPCPFNDAWSLDLNDKSWTRVAESTSASSVPVPRRNANAWLFADGKHVLFYGGSTSGDQVMSISEPANNEFAVLEVTSSGVDSSTKFKRVQSSGGPSYLIEGAAVTAISSSSLLLYGGERTKGNTGVSDEIWLLAGTVASAPEITNNNSFFSKLSLHLVLAFIAFGVLLPVCVLTARYLSTFERIWYPLFVALELIGTGIAIAAFVLYTQAVPHSKRFSHPHGIILAVAFALTLLQLVLAFGRPRLGTKARTIWVLVQQNLLRLAVVLGFVYVSMALLFAMVARPLWIAWFVYIGVYGLLTIGLEILHRRKTIVHRDVK